VGRGLEEVHDFIRRVLTLHSGSHVLGEAEFEAIFDTFATRKWAQRPVRRNYSA